MNQLNIITPLTLVDQSSRLMADMTMTIKPGQFVEVNATGKVAKVGATSVPAVMCRTGISGNTYEGHDTKAGRITVIESYGVRSIVSTDVIEGTVAGKDFLSVVTGDASKSGKIKKAVAGEFAVAMCVAVNGSEYEIKTISPYKFA